MKTTYINIAIEANLTPDALEYLEQQLEKFLNNNVINNGLDIQVSQDDEGEDQQEQEVTEPINTCFAYDEDLSNGEKIQYIADCVITEGKMALEYYYRYYVNGNYSAYWTMKNPIAMYDDKLDNLIEQARQYAEMNKLTLWTY